jgi:hypothetical protein
MMWLIQNTALDELEILKRVYTAVQRTPTLYRTN